MPLGKAKSPVALHTITSSALAIMDRHVSKFGGAASVASGGGVGCHFSGVRGKSGGLELSVV